MIDVLDLVRWAAAILCAISLATLALTVGLGLLAPVLMGRRPRRADQPPVSFVTPIKTYEPGFIAAQNSIFEQTYPHCDVTITAAEVESPAIAAAREIIARHPGVSARIVRSTATFAASPKVNNLYQAVEDAPADIIVMKDSNIVLSPDGAQEAVAAMTDDVGLVVAVPEARGAEDFAAGIEGSVMNQLHARLLLAAAALGLGFGVGKLMVFRRSNLHRIGGFPAIAHSVGEDSAMDHAFKEIGLRTVFMKPPITQTLGRRRLGDVFHRQLRWAVIRRNNELLVFLVEPFQLSTCAAIAGAIAAPLFGWSAFAGATVTLALWFGFETLLALARGWDVSMTAPATMIARDALMLGVWVCAWFTKRVVWAAEVYDAHRECGPQPAPAPSAAPASKRNDT